MHLPRLTTDIFGHSPIERWLVRPGDILVVPTPIDRRFLEYATGLCGFEPADITMLGSETVRGTDFTEAVLGATADERAGQAWPYHYDRAGDGPGVLDRVLEYGDGWVPILAMSVPSLADRMAEAPGEGGCCRTRANTRGGLRRAAGREGSGWTAGAVRFARVAEMYVE
ncbi:preATP grasp domain-containing protein [Amycolatopsis aidingensis]|uniref:preATP grasp domain-containing protein n=1 Tax=Amycolatopsis aidingensis TaxID=2842453 RepID=UPI001C0C86C0